MDDRNVQYPNRFRMQKVAGTDDIYDLIPAPGEITAEGTLINKATLLKDTTAALFGYSENQWPKVVPDDVLKVLSRFQKGLGNEYVWGKLEPYEVLTDAGEIEFGRKGMVGGGVSESDVRYSTAVKYVNGDIVMVDPVETTVSVLAAKNFSDVKGKYYQEYYDGGAYQLYKISENFTTRQTGSGVEGNPYVYYCSSGASTVAFKTNTLGYLNSPDPSAYPPAEDDGYIYTSLGQMGSKVQIATGSYTGTGTYGSSSPNSLTFDFEPKFFLLYEKVGSNNVPTHFFDIQGKNYINCESLTTEFTSYTGIRIAGNSIAGNDKAKKSSDGKTISWVSTSASMQGNESDYKYNYIAIG